MANEIGNGVTLRGFDAEDFSYTWYISGTLTQADVGKALSQDTTSAKTAKLAVDGETLIGGLKTYEDRVQEGVKVGTVKRKGTFLWGYEGTAPALGDSVVGSAVPGRVRTAGAAIPNNIVVEVDTVAKTVVVVFD